MKSRCYAVQGFLLIAVVILHSASAVAQVTQHEQMLLGAMRDYRMTLLTGQLPLPTPSPSPTPAATPYPATPQPVASEPVICCLMEFERPPSRDCILGLELLGVTFHPTYDGDKGPTICATAFGLEAALSCDGSWNIGGCIVF